MRSAQALLVLAAAGLWLASRLPWVVLEWEWPDELAPPNAVTVTGAQWSAALVPLAVVLAAAALAGLAARGWALRFLAVLVAGVCAAVLYLGITLWLVRDPAVWAADVAEVPVGLLVSSGRRYVGAAVTVAAGVASLIAAILLMRAAPGGARPADKYAGQRSGNAAASGADQDAAMSERTLWDALDEGSDPTLDSDTEGR